MNLKKSQPSWRAMCENPRRKQKEVFIAVSYAKIPLDDTKYTSHLTEKFKKQNFTKISKFCSLKFTVKERKRQATDHEKIHPKHTDLMNRVHVIHQIVNASWNKHALWKMSITWQKSKDEVHDKLNLCSRGCEPRRKQWARGAARPTVSNRGHWRIKWKRTPGDKELTLTTRTIKMPAKVRPPLQCTHAFGKHSALQDDRMTSASLPPTPPTWTSSTMTASTRKQNSPMHSNFLP